MNEITKNTCCNPENVKISIREQEKKTKEQDTYLQTITI